MVRGAVPVTWEEGNEVLVLVLVLGLVLVARGGEGRRGGGRDRDGGGCVTYYSARVVSR